MNRNRDRHQRSYGSKENLECQDGDSWGVNYSGNMNHTTSGRACQAWSAQEPHQHEYTEIGEHNHCRNSFLDVDGVWCFTTDPDMLWDYCPVPICAPMLKVLDFSADNDHEPDSNGEYSGATLEAGPLPETFTICSAFMVEAWITDFSTADMFTVLGQNGFSWMIIYLWAASSYTEYSVYLGPFYFVNKTKSVFFPLQWTRACFSLDSVASKVMLVVDGQLLFVEEYRREEDYNRPDNISLLLGNNMATEDSARISELNIFNSSLSSEEMIVRTTAGGEGCGEPGDLINWEEAEWTLHSQAKVIEVDREWEGPCRREPKVQVFMADFTYNLDCMRHCQKIVGGRTPPVTTKEEWEMFKREVDLVTQVRSRLSQLWLPATEGDLKNKLGRQEHWPETELVNNKIVKLEAQETVWRDFYTGERMDNWTIPFYTSGTDTWFAENANCMLAYTDKSWEESWREWECWALKQSCPCSYPAQPILRLRGLCSDWVDRLFSPKQLPDSPDNMIIYGIWTTRIEYNHLTSQWMLSNVQNSRIGAGSYLTAVSRASSSSYALGKHEWTISNDTFKCGKGKPYTTMLKLTGCAEDEFTCDDGQCIKMERRCDQVTGMEPNCRDRSDEKGCKLIVLKDEEGYNKNIPPIESRPDGSFIPCHFSKSTDNEPPSGLTPNRYSSPSRHVTDTICFR